MNLTWWSEHPEPGMNVSQPETCVLIRWTVLMPTWCNAAVFRTLTPASAISGSTATAATST
jgi:hypothetical protein